MLPSNNDNEDCIRQGAPCISAFLKTVSCLKLSSSTLKIGGYYTGRTP